MNFVICKRNRLQTYLLTNLIINLMVLVDKENVKGYVQMDEKEHTKKEYASKGLAGTALGLGIGGLAVAAICVSKHVAAFVVYILNTKNLLLFFVLFQVILYLLAAIILKCIII